MEKGFQWVSFDYEIPVQKSDFCLPMYMLVSRLEAVCMEQEADSTEEQ